MLRRVSQNGATIEYQLKQTDRKDLECRVALEGITVYVPKRLPLREADAFVLSRASWIIESLNRLKTRAEEAAKRLAQSMSDDSIIPIEGKDHRLLCLPGNQTVVRLDKGNLVVFGAGHDPESVRDAIRAFLIRTAMIRFEERVKYYAEKIGVQPNRITLREQKTKWGSCSSRGNLNFNWKLIMAPPEALDYVVVHELCHLIELNHSPAFWALVEGHMPDYKRWQDYLKKGIKSPFG